MMHNPPPVLDHACDLHVELGPIREMGRGRDGMRRIVPIIGGHFEGPLLIGQVLGIGADWQTGWADGLSELDTRYGLETHDAQRSIFAITVIATARRTCLPRWRVARLWIHRPITCEHRRGWKPATTAIAGSAASSSSAVAGVSPRRSSSRRFALR